MLDTMLMYSPRTVQPAPADFFLRPRAVLILVFALLNCASSLCAELYIPQATVGQATSLIRSAEADIRSADSSAGTAARPAKGGRLKLTKMRLNSAKTRLAQAADLLKQVAKSDPAATAAQARYRTAMTAIAGIEARLGGGKAKPVVKPTGSSTGKPDTNVATPAKTDARLDYKQEKLLKDAHWYLNETIKYCGPASKVEKQLTGKGPQPLHAEIKSALASIQLGIPKYNLAVDYLSRLPAGHSQVDAVRTQVAKAGATLGALQSRLKAVSSKLQKVTGLENYPNFKRDYELVGDLSRRYGDFQAVSQQPKKLAQIITEDGASIAEFKRIAKLYAPLAEQQTAAGIKMEKRVKYALGRRQTFSGLAMAHRKVLPEAIGSDIAAAEKMSVEAVEKKKPGWFGENSGIAQRFGWAEDKLLVLRAFGTADAKLMDAKVASARLRIAGRAKLLSADIIASNPLPPDAYRGADRAALVKLASKTWQAEQAGAKILGVRIPSQAWQRSTRWQVSRSGFYKVDASKLQIQLLIKHDDKLAVVRPINLFKNHLAGDTIKAFPFSSATEEIQPHSLLRQDKIKN